MRKFYVSDPLRAFKAVQILYCMACHKDKCFKLYDIFKCIYDLLGPLIYAFMAGQSLAAKITIIYSKIKLHKILCNYIC